METGSLATDLMPSATHVFVAAYSKTPATMDRTTWFHPDGTALDPSLWNEINPLNHVPPEHCSVFGVQDQKYHDEQCDSKRTDIALAVMCQTTQKVVSRACIDIPQGGCY